MHAADPDRCIRQRGKTSGLIGLECSERYFENAVAGRGNLRRPQFYFYVLSSCLAFRLLFALPVLFSEFLQLLLRQLLRNGITKLLKLRKPLAGNLRILRIHVNQRVAENFADQIPHVPLVIRRHDIPRGFPGCSCVDCILEDFLVGIPVSPLFPVARRELPVLLRLLNSGQEAQCLLVL